MTALAASSPHERLATIEQRIKEDGSVRIDDLAARLRVSEMTIRRDLDELDALGAARRVRGGAVAVGPEPFSERHRHNARAKARIADRLLGLIPERGTVAFDASSTVYRLATRLDGARDLVVVTNGPDAFQSLTGKAGIVATLTGGSVEPRTGSLVGPVAVRGAEAFLFDVFLCSAASLDPDLGSSEASLEEAEVKRALGSRSGRIILAVDHTKLGTRAQAGMFGLDEIDLLVTDLDPGDKALDPYRASVKIG